MDQILVRQVTTYLSNRKRQLEETIRHIEKTIASLSKSPFKQTQVQLSSDTEVQKKAGRPSGRRKGPLKLKTEEKFNPHSKLDRKIAYVITRFGSGFKDDIVAELHALQPELDAHKLEKQLAVRLSYLLKIEAIQGNKISRRYRYSLFK